MTAERKKFMKKLYPLILDILAALCLSTAVIIFAVFFTLKFKPLYKFDIKHLNIESSSKLDSKQLTKNYLTITGYIKNPSIEVLNLPDLKLSANAQTHFVEVKKIFMLLKYIFYGCVLLGGLCIYFLYKKEHFKFYKYTSISLAIIPALLAIPFLINFDKSFTIFHKIFFKNGYWEFDPAIDPIINTLPQQFFFHCSLLILTIMLVFSLYFTLLYKEKLKREEI